MKILGGRRARRCGGVISKALVTASLGFAGLVALSVGAMTPASAAPTSLSSPTALSGDTTLGPTPYNVSGSGVTATFNLTTELNWSQVANLGTTFDPNQVRQGQTPNPSDSFTRPLPGSMSVTWTLNNLQLSWNGIGPIGLGSPQFSTSGSCSLMAGGPNYDCSFSSNQDNLLDTYPVPG